MKVPTGPLRVGSAAQMRECVPRTTCRSLEFHRAVEVIAAGRELAMRALDDFDIDADFSDP